MSAEHASLADHPAPHRDRVMTLETAFGLFAGPAGWFLQLCAGYGLASMPCFADRTRTPAMADAAMWAWHTMIVATIVGLVLGLLGLWVAWRALRKTKEEVAGTHRHLIEIGSGRTRFLALWGVCFSAGASVVILATFVGYVVLPRCVG
jgi:hypothetical protein